MKCVKNLKTGVITRVSDDVADKMVKNRDSFWFAPKSEWRLQNAKPVVTEESTEKSKKQKKNKKQVNATV